MRTLMAAAGPRSSGLSRRVSVRAAWIYKYCKDSPCTYFRAVEIAYRFVEASGRDEDDPDVFLAATVIASKIENEMSVPIGDVHKVRGGRFQPAIPWQWRSHRRAP